MTRETRIGLLVGLGFIIMFGLVLSELTGTAPPPRPAEDVTADDAGPYAYTALADPGPGGSESATDLAARRPEAPDRADRDPAVVRSETRRPTEPDRRLGTVTVSLTGSERPAPAPTGRRAPRGPRTPTTGWRKYTVVSNDSLIKIARKVYGRGREMAYKRIYQANRDVLPNERTISPGQVLKIPPLSAAPVRRPGTTPPTGAPRKHYVTADLSDLARVLSSRRVAGAGRRVYVVRHGDSLTKIARKMLDDDSRASVMKLYNANKDRLRDPNDLPVGVSLRIPS